MQTGTQKGLARVKFTIDAIASRFTVQAFATGMLSAFGHNPTIAIRDYDGAIQFTPDTIADASVRVAVRTSTMEVVDEMKNDDRKKLEQDDVRTGFGSEPLRHGCVRRASRSPSRSRATNCGRRTWLAT